MLSFSPERPEVPGQVVQDRPYEVSVGPPGAYRVGVVGECDPGRLARVSCPVHRRLVRSQRFQPTVQLRRRSMCGQVIVGDPVAVVVACDRYVARDAADAVMVDYEPLPAVVDPEKKR